MSLIPAELQEPTAIYSLLFTLLLITVSFVAAYGFLSREKFKTSEKYVFAWLTWDALVHFILEGSFVYMSVLGRTVETSSGRMAELWKEYGKADSRWLIAEPTVVSIEIPTFIVCGPLSVLVLWAIIKDHPIRHPLQFLLCTCELYGGYLTWMPEYLTGNKSLATDNPLYLWVYMVLFNGLWVLVPMFLLIQSWFELLLAAEFLIQHRQAKKSL
ncbi:13423_t:CDS:2 [Ambispora gerdemannii]|uniref:13423_t:CDS:1 n=1 Tax=Ambispora gerdemannii TaxID=144530 RepID=A0A9N9FY20_9GLOM|nr:13423_t:CDS:2 [Ambispora gerdemannii]